MFKEGRCGWHLSSVNAQVQRGSDEPLFYVTLTMGTAGSSDNHGPEGPGVYKLDLWCYQFVVYRCDDTQTAMSNVSELMQGIPLSERGNYLGYPNIYKGLSNVVVTLHELE